jgi:hypothetical protein
MTTGWLCGITVSDIRGTASPCAGGKRHNNLHGVRIAFSTRSGPTPMNDSNQPQVTFKILPRRPRPASVMARVLQFM